MFFIVKQSLQHTIQAVLSVGAVVGQYLLQFAETIVFNIGQKVILAAVIFIKCDPVKLGFGA